MLQNPALRVALLVTISFAGGSSFERAGIPAGSLLGATLAATAFALTRYAIDIPVLLRNVSFAMIGVALGSGVTPKFFSDLARYPLSLAGLTASVVAVMLISSWVMIRAADLDGRTAFLATSPGALAYALDLSTRARESADVRVVMVLQSVRLLLITLALPPIIALVERAGSSLPSAPVEAAGELGLAASFLLLAAAYLAGIGGSRIGLPSAYFLCGVFVSGLAHGSDLVEGQPAGGLVFAGFILAGAMIGSRFFSFEIGDLKHLAKAGIVATGIATALSAGFALTFAILLGLPFGQVWIAYAPGGVEGMSAMALTLEYDPVYVATHHIFRLFLLIALLPLLLRDSGRHAN